MLSLSPADVDRTWDLFPHHCRYAPSRASVSHAPVLPPQLAATINQYDDTLYRFAHAFYGSWPDEIEPSQAAADLEETESIRLSRAVRLSGKHFEVLFGHEKVLSKHSKVLSGHEKVL